MAMIPARNCLDIGILCADIKRSLDFYEGLLGLKKIGEMPIPFGHMHRLAFGDSFVKLVDPKKIPPAGELGLTRALGFRYLTFQITNIDEVCAACEAAGVTFDIPRQELMPGVTIAMVRDPDGNVVEFVQRA
jgi:catechol 2,3-dioxygenase-like lactoylglutathione lyase family enzyme